MRASVSLSVSVSLGKTLKVLSLLTPTLCPSRLLPASSMELASSPRMDAGVLEKQEVGSLIKQLTVKKCKGYRKAQIGQSGTNSRRAGLVYSMILTADHAVMTMLGYLHLQPTCSGWHHIAQLHT